jgi:phage tail tape-measure protein
VGNIVPVDVAVANGTEEPYRIDPAQVFALDSEGRQIKPVPLEEVIAEMARANALATELRGAAKTALVSGIVGAAAGAAVGAAVGTIVASPAQGALLGAAIGGGVGTASGVIVGGLKGHAASRYEAETQIYAVALRAQELGFNPSSQDAA